MEITIRKADAADLDAVARVYEHVHDAEEAGPAQVGWVRGVYPVRSTAEAALERGDLFVEEADGAVVGTGIFNRLQADVYAGAPWQYDAPDDQIMVLHTLAVDPQAGKRGLGRAFAAFYEQYAREHGCRYLRIVCFSYPAVALTYLLSNVLRGTERVRLPLYVSIVTTIANAFADYGLIFGAFGLPRLGVEGAAIATFISQAVGGVLPVFYFLNKRSTSSIHLGRAQWNGGVICSACINGSSELMTNLSMSLVNILYNYQLLRFAGENGVAAYGVIMYAAFLFVAVFVGYAVGSAPIVSYHYGARNHAELNNLYSKSLRLIGVIAVVMTVLSMLVIPYVARIFVGYDAELLALIFLPMVLGIEGVWLAVTAAEAGALCVTVLMFITKDKVFHYRKVSC